MSEHEAGELQAEFDEILKHVAALNPVLVTLEEWQSFKRRISELEARLARLGATARGDGE